MAVLQYILCGNNLFGRRVSIMERLINYLVGAFLGFVAGIIVAYLICQTV